MSFTRATYITEEPDAVVPHVRICMGAAQVTGRSTMTSLLRRHVAEKKIVAERAEADDMDSSHLCVV